VNFQAVDLFLECRAGGEQGRYDHHGSQVRRNAVAQGKARQDRGAEHSHDATIHQRNRGIERGDKPETASTRSSERPMPHVSSMNSGSDKTTAPTRAIAAR